MTALKGVCIFSCTKFTITEAIVDLSFDQKSRSCISSFEHHACSERLIASGKNEWESR
jgi:hypothetical protein